MGTSKAYGGPATGLVPDFVDNPPEPTLPLPHTTQDVAPSSPVAPRDSSGAGPLSSPKGDFTRYARSGSRSALGKAVANYVRNGTGGAGRASRRMGSSRVVAGGLLGILGDFQQGGATQVLQRFNLGGLSGQPAATVFVSLIEFLCPPGGSVDEGIARQAMLDTIGDMSESCLESFDALTPEQLQEVFIGFVVHSIEGRIMADIGHNAIKLPEDIQAIGDIQATLHDFVDTATRTHLRDELGQIDGLSGSAVEDKVERIYEYAFELITSEGERAE
ncbi:Qat anti-phage system associated protein QatB [Rahnella sp. ChDrAdgB13]|uniref:Qat anti-phage system associated protein QatB n=1 Tax=Rahnella sp. ChDrAdgB13 TaxID=1850581 RepID=UPI001AD88F29|nr:Qat anti-phage system associated protein QatB [Rahnella sp. ChDrAdgB13]